MFLNINILPAMALLLIASPEITAQSCPPAIALSPCTCTESNLTISCTGIRGIFDIKTLFDNVSLLIDSDIVFSDLEIRDTSLLQIPSGSIQTLKFSKITIQENENLELISPDAFNSTYEVTTVLNLGYNYLSNKGSNERQIFDFINKFTHLRSLSLIDNQLTSIPENAFGALESLAQIDFEDNYISNIGIGAFAQLSNLTSLNIVYNKLPSEGIPSDAFLGITNVTRVDLEFNDETTYLAESSYKTLVDNALSVSIGGGGCSPGGGCQYRRFTCDENADWLCQNADIYKEKLFGFKCTVTDPYYVEVWNYCDGDEYDL